MLRVHTAVHHRLDVVEVWHRAMRHVLPEAELHVWYSDARPRVGDVLHRMPHVGIGAARWVMEQLPGDGLRVFVESDMIPVRAWSPDDYPGPLRLLEGSPGRRWFGLAVARPGVSIYSDPVLIPQRYLTAAGCPSWLPAEFCETSLAADSKIAGDHFLHIDKVHRGAIADQAKKDALITILRRHFPKPRPGLGDRVASALAAVGITPRLVERVTGRPCGCKKRAAALNAVGRRLGIG